MSRRADREGVACAKCGEPPTGLRPSSHDPCGLCHGAGGFTRHEPLDPLEARVELRTIYAHFSRRCYLAQIVDERVMAMLRDRTAHEGTKERSGG